MKKILHISKFYYPYFGGIEDMVLSIVSEMKGRYEQRVVCFNHEQTGTIRTMNNGVEVIRVSAPVTVSSQPLSLSYYRILRDEIKRYQPDIIHVHFPNPLVGTLLLMIPLDKVKLIIHWHSDIIGKNALYRLYRPLEKRILQRADVILVTSMQYAEHSQPLQPFMHKINVLPSIVNEEKLKLQPADAAIIQGIRDRFKGKKIILFVGRHVPYKGIDILVKAASYLPDDYVVLIGGTGEQTEALQQMAKPLGDKMLFIGRLRDREMRCFMHAASVFAFPSIDRREAFGLALAEALYCGLPAVAFHIEGSGSVWVNQDGKTGIIVPQQDAQAYAKAICSLLENEPLREQYSRAATEWVKNHFLKDQIQTLPEIYN